MRASGGKGSSLSSPHNFGIKLTLKDRVNCTLNCFAFANRNNILLYTTNRNYHLLNIKTFPHFKFNNTTNNCFKRQLNFTSKREFFDVKEKFKENEQKRSEKQIEEQKEERVTPEIAELANIEFMSYQEKLFEYKINGKIYDRSFLIFLVLFIIFLFFGIMSLFTLRQKLYIFDLEDHFANAKTWKLLSSEELQDKLSQERIKMNDNTNDREDEDGDEDFLIHDIPNKSEIETYKYISETPKSLEEQLFKAFLAVSISTSVGYFWSLFRTSVLWFSFLKKPENQQYAKYPKLPVTIAKKSAARSALFLILASSFSSVVQLFVEKNTGNQGGLTDVFEKKYFLTHNIAEKFSGVIEKQIALVAANHILTSGSYLIALYNSRFVIFPLFFGDFMAKQIVSYQRPLRKEVIVEAKYNIYFKEGDGYAKLCKELTPISERVFDLRKLLQSRVEEEISQKAT